MMVTERMWLRPWSFNEIQDLAMQCFYLTAIVSTKIVPSDNEAESRRERPSSDKKT